MGVHTGSHGIYQCYACCNSTKQWLLKLSNCVSLSLLSMVGLIRASGGWPGLRAAWGGRDGIESFEVQFWTRFHAGHKIEETPPRESPPVSLWPPSPPGSSVCLGPICLGPCSTRLWDTVDCSKQWDGSPLTWSDRQGGGWLSRASPEALYGLLLVSSILCHLLQY